MSYSIDFNYALEPKSLRLLASLISFKDKSSVEMTASRVNEEAVHFLKALIAHPSLSQDAKLFHLCQNTLSYFSINQPVFSRSDALPTDTSNLQVEISETQIQINVSGLHGIDGKKGKPAKLQGEHGTNGEFGTQGDDSGNIVLKLSYKEGLLTVDWISDKAVVAFKNPLLSIRLFARGGNGGNGGSGGDGAPGKDGLNGTDARKYCLGKDGEKGQNGGSGGDGGDGGNGGQIQVIVEPEDGDLLMLLEKADTTAGLPGEGGGNGRGAEGGKGGNGGRSLTWNALKPNPFYNRSLKEPMTILTPHFEKGGVDGMHGTTGVDGSIGRDGMSGTDGIFAMYIGGISYNMRYDFTIQASKVVDEKIGNAQEFCEPGEVIFLILSIANNGRMPKPKRDIEVGLARTDWADLGTSSFILPSSIPLSYMETYIFPKPLILRVKDLDPAKIDEKPLIKQEIAHYHAYFQRDQSSFICASKRQDRFTIRYPVEMLPITAASTEKVYKISTIIKNIGPRNLGKDSQQQRRVFVVFQTENCKVNFIHDDLDKTIEYLDRSSLPKNMMLEDHQNVFEIKSLEPHGLKKMVLSVLPFSIEPQIRVVAKLYLQQQGASGDVPFSCIQKRFKAIELPS